MNTEILLKEFKEILDLEKRAKNLYDHYIAELGEGEIKEKLVSIREDEKFHIKLAEALIDCVS